MHLVITGLMASGKSTVGRLVAAASKRTWRDSDDDIERLTGRTGRAIAGDEGVDALHDLEEAVLLGALAQREPLVISAAAWVVESARCRTALARTAKVVVLDAPPDVLLERLGGGAHRRPIDAPALRELAARRAPLFAEVADLTLDATEPPDRLADETLALISQPTEG